MLCKYCHLKTHFIDKCPTIICKNCKEIGHPQWLCKDKKNNKNEKNNMNKNIIEKKYNFTDEIKKKIVIENNIQKNISYFLKIEKQNWGDLINL